MLFRKEYACEFCGIRDTRSNISKHDEICQKKLVPCPNDLCTEKIERCGVEGHVTNDCGYTVISCRYVDIGCEVKLKRHDMPDHERDAAQHLAFAMDAILSMKKTVDELESKSNTTLRQGEPLRLKISDFERKRVNNEPYHSSSFYSCQYHLEIIVYPNGFGHGKGRYASIYARILQGDYDSELTWPFAGKITITLLNQLVDESHYTRSKNLTIHLRDRDGFTQGCSKFILHSKLGPDPVKNTQYLMNDSLHFRIFIQVDGIKHWLQ